MANRRLHGRYYITNLENGTILLNVGISRSAAPVRPVDPAAVIVLPQGVLPPRFTVVPVVGQNNPYIITAESRTVGHQASDVVAFENNPADLWVIRYREDRRAFTIESADGTLAWTVSAAGPVPRKVVLTAPANPPSATQLFNLEHVPSE